MRNVRLGAVPSTAVYMPCPAPVRRRSSQYGKIAAPKPVAGRQVFVKAVLVVVNCTLPLEMALRELYVVPYSLTGKGSATLTEQSSQLLPASRVVPATTVPVAVATL